MWISKKFNEEYKHTYYNNQMKSASKPHIENIAGLFRMVKFPADLLLRLIDSRFAEIVE